MENGPTLAQKSKCSMHVLFHEELCLLCAGGKTRKIALKSALDLNNLIISDNS